jgi:hypothetical protein
MITVDRWEGSGHVAVMVPGLKGRRLVGQVWSARPWSRFVRAGSQMVSAVEPLATPGAEYTAGDGGRQGA